MEFKFFIKKINFFNKNKKINIKNKKNQLIKLNLNNFEILSNQSILLKNINENYNGNIVWESTNDIVNIENGYITPKSKGSTIIKAIGTNNTEIYELNIYDEQEIKTIDAIKYDMDNILYCLNSENFNDNIWTETYLKSNPNITGQLIKNNNAIVFNGTQTLSTTGITNKYGFGTATTKSNYAYILKINLKQLKDINIYSGLQIRSDSSIFLNNIQYDTQLKTNTDYIIIYQKYHGLLNDEATTKTFNDRIIISNGFNSGYVNKGGGNWCQDLTIPIDFIGDLYYLKLYDGILTEQQINYIFNEKYIIGDPYLNNMQRYIEKSTDDIPTIAISVDNNGQKLANL